MFPGGGELLFIVLVVLLLFGGKELPRIARLMGQWSSTMRRSLNEVRREFNRISISEEMKEVSNAVKGKPERSKQVVQPPEGKTAARTEESIEDEEAEPKLQYPEAIEPHRDPSVPAPKPLKEKSGETSASHPEQKSENPESSS